MWFIILSANAAELNFSPDRPGVGESPGVVGAGHVMIEGGVSVLPTDPNVTVGGWYGRIGVDDGIELRVKAPDIVIVEDFGVGPVGVGAKVAGAIGKRWSVSVAPELQYDLVDGTPLGLINANLGFAAGRFTMWAHSSTTFSSEGVGLFVGGGTSLAFGLGGAYLNGGYTIAGSGLAGGGGWIQISDHVQFDVGLDVSGVPDAVTPVAGAGISLGW